MSDAFEKPIEKVVGVCNDLTISADSFLVRIHGENQDFAGSIWLGRDDARAIAAYLELFDDLESMKVPLHKIVGRDPNKPVTQLSQVELELVPSQTVIDGIRHIGLRITYEEDNDQWLKELLPGYQGSSFFVSAPLKKYARIKLAAALHSAAMTSMEEERRTAPQYSSPASDEELYERTYAVTIRMGQ